MPWQKQLGNLPATLSENQSLTLEGRFDPKKLQSKKGIVGVVQHGDLFWDAVSEQTIGRVLDTVDADALRRQQANSDRTRRSKVPDTTKYILWTKRAERMADIVSRRYADGVPDYLGCGVSVENQETADKRLPHLMRLNGHRFVMIEPMLGPIDLGGYEQVSWVVCGSETGSDRARKMDLEWARSVRDFSVLHGIPFFIKQLGNDHRQPQRELDGRTWDEFPPGFTK